MKICERVVQSQIVDYFNEHLLFTDAQHGYRRDRSTETALTVITDKLYRAMDNGEVSVLVMGVTLYTFEVPLGTPMKKVGTSGTPMLEALLKA